MYCNRIHSAFEGVEQGMTKLILIRHGESLFNLEKRYTGQLDVPLTEKGLEQAKITADYLLKNYKIDEIYSSDLSRAIETAKPIAEPLGIKIKTDVRLREIYAGAWQGLLFSEVKEKHREDYELYKANPATGRSTGGESMADVLRRVHAAILDIVRDNPEKTVLVSFHNGPLKALQAPLLGIGLNETKNLTNNSITEVDFDGDVCKIIRLGYDGHLGNLSTGFTEKTAN